MFYWNGFVGFAHVNCQLIAFPATRGGAVKACNTRPNIDDYIVCRQYLCVCRGLNRGLRYLTFHDGRRSLTFGRQHSL